MRGSASPAVKRIGGENKLENSVPVLTFLQMCMGYDSQSQLKPKWARKYSLLYLFYSLSLQFESPHSTGALET